MKIRGRHGDGNTPQSVGSKIRSKAFVAGAGVFAVALLASACSSSSNSSSTTTSTAAAASSTSTTAMANPLAALESYVPASSSVTLSETGSSLMYPLFNVWVPLFQKQWPNYSITTASTGSGTGITDATNGTVQIGASDAYLSNTVVAANPGLMNIPMDISAQMVNYNIPGLAAGTNLKLSGQVLSSMYQGKITTWNDPAIMALNPGVTIPNVPVAALHRSDSSGDTFLFTSFLTAADANGWGKSIGPGTSVTFPSAPGSAGENGNGGMVSGCQATPGCVAYIGISYQAKITAANLGTAQLQNQAGAFELPTQATISAEAASYASNMPATGTISMIYGTAATGYPIVNYEYAIVQKTQTSTTVAQAIQSFLAWSMDPQYGSAPANLSQVNFQPMPAAAIAIAAKMLASITG